MRKQTIVFVVFAVALLLGLRATHASAAWQIETVPCTRTPGGATLALDAESLPHIAITADNYLMYVYKDVSGWQEETLGGEYEIGPYLPIIELDTHDYPYIFYAVLWGTGSSQLPYTGTYNIVSKTSSEWGIQSVGSVGMGWGDVGRYAFALDSNGEKHSYRIQTSFAPQAYYDTAAGPGGLCDDLFVSDLDMDSGNYPHIFYRTRIGVAFIIYSYKDGSGWHTETVDISGSTADYLSIALDSNDRPHVSYYDNANKDLKYAYRDGTGWHLETVDSAGDVGMYNAIGVDSQDRPHISYYDETNGDLKYARREGSAWQIAIVDGEGTVGLGTSLDIDSQDRPHILYRDETNAVLKYAQADAHPRLVAGPNLAAGTWPLLSSSQASPTYMGQNYSVVWAFSDDFAACSDDCEHTAEYSVAGEENWSPLTPASDAELGFAWVELPITSLENATTYAFRFAVTDCASQTTQSNTYYFRVATSDEPPVIGDGPFLAAGSWPVLPIAASRAFILNQDSYVLSLTRRAGSMPTRSCRWRAWSRARISSGSR